jgi:heat-inducible transcriptional repressor
MTDDRKPESEPTLDERRAEILKAIIHEHIVTGDPIGSRTVASAARLDLSPATIRSVMAELEEMGLLSQPHTSAGRVPTDAAYRVYVDELVSKPRVAASQAQAIDRALLDNRGELPDLLGEASRQLSSLSNQVGLVLAPELERLIVEHVEFVRLDERRVVAILVARSGVVHNRILDVREAWDQQELDRLGRYLSSEFGGRTLPEMRDLLRQSLYEERAAYDRRMAEGLDLGQRAVAPENVDTAVFVGGASNLLEAPELTDPDVMRGLFKTLEEKKTLIELLSRVLGGQGVQVVIGRENPLADLARCSLITSSYRAGEQVLGTVGIVGPIRMQYARAIALVDYLAQVLTRLLSAPGN